MPCRVSVAIFLTQSGRVGREDCLEEKERSAGHLPSYCPGYFFKGLLEGFFKGRCAWRFEVFFEAPILFILQGVFLKAFLRALFTAF